VNDIRVPMSGALAAFGVPAVVTPPGEEAIETTAIWLSPVAEDVPSGQDLQRREMRRVLALDRAMVPTVSRGTIIVAAEKASDLTQTWRVDEVDLKDPDHVRVRVIPVGEES
jgi:hypothetical protein